MRKTLGTLFVVSFAAVADEPNSPNERENSRPDSTALVFAKPTLNVSHDVWATLTIAHRNSVTSRYTVEVSEKGRFARIVYVQPVNESTAGTNAGAQLGSALGQAQYIDKSSWSNYSARGQLGAAILGGLLGSALDARPQTVYRLVYTLKSGDGSIRVVERVSGSQIHIAPGLCIDTTVFTPVSDELCGIAWPEEIRAVLESAGGSGQAPSRSSPGQAISTQSSASTQQPPITLISRDDLIYCRFGPTSTVQTSAVKCLQAGGTIHP